jgi:hypothetical protein
MNHLAGRGFEGMEQEEHHFALRVRRIHAHTTPVPLASGGGRGIGVTALIRRTRCCERAHVCSKSWGSSAENVSAGVWAGDENIQRYLNLGSQRPPRQKARAATQGAGDTHQH